MLEKGQKEAVSASQSFKSLDKAGKGRVDLKEMLKTLKSSGFSRKDPRLKDFYSKIDKLDGVNELTKKEFEQLTQDQTLLFEKIFQNQLVIQTGEK